MFEPCSTGGGIFGGGGNTTGGGFGQTAGETTTGASIFSSGQSTGTGAQGVSLQVQGVSLQVQGSVYRGTGGQSIFSFGQSTGTRGQSILDLASLQVQTCFFAPKKNYFIFKGGGLFSGNQSNQSAAGIFSQPATGTNTLQT